MPDHYGSVSRVKEITGVEPADLGLQDSDSPGDDLNQTLKEWLKEITSRIDATLPQGHVDSQEDIRNGIDGVANRKCSDLVAYSRYQRSSPVVQVDEFTMQVINSSDVLDGIDDDLDPYKQHESTPDGSGDSGSIGIYSSSGDF